MSRPFISAARRSLRGCRFKPSLGMCLFEEGYCLDILGFLIAVPLLDRFWHHPYEIMERWGVYYFERSVWLCWGRHSKAIHMPWDFTFIRHDVRRPDGSWAKFIGSWEKDAGTDGRWQAEYPYRYTLKSGEIQERTATVFVERREWRWKCLKWLPLFAKKRVSIDVEFSDEVGERTGSWKGGCIGCGWDLRKGESPLEALRRMERERVFD